MLYIQTQNVLIPRQVFIGDKAELQCTFTHGLFKENEGLSVKKIENLSLSYFMEPLLGTEYDITSVTLKENQGGSYSLVIGFVPWKTGLVQFPDFDIEGAIGGQENHIGIQFEPIEIISLTERDSVSSVQSMEGTLLLPGTVYQLYALAIFLIVFLIFFINLIVRHKKVISFFKKQRMNFRFKKNRRNTERQISAILEDENLSAHDIAQEIQKVLRAYLQNRLDFPFTKVLSSQIKQNMTTVILQNERPVQGDTLRTNQSDLAEEKREAVNNFEAVFLRTDFLRYSQSASFFPNEKESLKKTIFASIQGLEFSPPKNKEIKNEGGYNA